MKKTALTLVSLLALAGSVAAAPLRALPVNSNEITPSVIFRDQELFFDLYGSYLQHDDSDRHSDGSQHGFGGGFTIGTYFAYYIGARLDLNFSSVSASKSNISGDVLIRYPIPESKWAPYAFAGGGVQAAEDSNGFIRLGAGIEWRMNPHFSFFGEGSYAWLFQDSTADNATIKIGIRYIY